MYIIIYIIPNIMLSNIRLCIKYNIYIYISFSRCARSSLKRVSDGLDALGAKGRHQGCVLGFSLRRNPGEGRRGLFCGMGKTRGGAGLGRGKIKC